MEIRRKIEKYGNRLIEIEKLKKMLKKDDDSPLYAGYVLMGETVKYVLNQQNIGNNNIYNELNAGQLYEYLIVLENDCNIKLQTLLRLRESGGGEVRKRSLRGLY